MRGLERLTRALRMLAFAAVVLLGLVAVAAVLRVAASVRGAVIVAAVALVAVVLLRLVQRRLPGRVILEVDLDAGLVEHVPDSPLGLVLGGKQPLRDVVEALDRAADDRRVVAAVVRLGNSGAGMGQAHELREALARLRRSGTRTIAVAETFGEAGNSTLDYYIASACDEIVLQRMGEFGVIGLLASTPFIRGLLERLDVTPRFDHRREYKSAMYLFTEEDMPQPQREASTRLLESGFERIVADVAKDRGLSPSVVATAIHEGPLLPREAFVRGLVDRLGFRDEMVEGLRTHLGAVPVDLATYRSRAVRSRRGATIALIHVHGAIVRGPSRPSLVGRGLAAGSDEVVEAVETAMRSDRVRAIVLRVDSPGGSAVASEAIWRAVQRAREAGKPVVASMGDVAGSGGYYVSCGADRIVAAPGTVTGSIGVVSGKLLTAAAWERVGVRWSELAAGEHADMWSPRSDFSDRQWQRFQRYLDDVYAGFKARVAEGRGLSPDQVEEVAQGRVWSGTDALTHGLVDELGGLHRAFEVARSLAGLDDDQRIRVRTFPERSKLPWRRLARGVADIGTVWDEVADGLGAASSMLELVVPPGVLWWRGRLH